ncbi:hypothetical protein LTR09_002341 [Extremus antarcticus]|uniref:Uncharacterized protein n=1 Tax=Extremus antarcticus TaxID=702011 RepID=A0AAJ0GFN2_9PEZI|nr:hypothetical protein LTR09_002341 [Extremus antarcticus]
METATPTALTSEGVAESSLPAAVTHVGLATSENPSVAPPLLPPLVSSHIATARRALPGHSEEVYYDQCTPAQLRRIIDNRRLTDPYPAGLTLYYYYIRELQRADRCLHFRFLDLPLEMRLMAYRELLQFDVDEDDDYRPIGRAYPTILRTCKLVYAEAKHILCLENTFSAVFKVQDGEVHRRVVRVHNDRGQDDELVNVKYCSLPRGMNDFPRFSRSISVLKVSLEWQDMPEKVPGLHYWGGVFNNNLHALAAFLVDGHNLKSLHIKLRLPEQLCQRGYESTLHPLRRLHNIPDFKLDGCPFPRIEARLKQDLRATRPSFNTLGYYRLLYEAAEWHTDYLQELYAKPNAHYECEHCDCHKCECEACDRTDDGGCPWTGCECDDCGCHLCRCQACGCDDRNAPEHLREIDDIFAKVWWHWQGDYAFSSRLEDKFLGCLLQFRDYLIKIPEEGTNEKVSRHLEESEAYLAKSGLLEQWKGETKYQGMGEPAARASYEPRYYEDGVEYETGGKWSDNEEIDLPPTSTTH